MNFFSTMLTGIGFFFKGIAICSEPSLRKYIFIPVIINFIITSIGLYFAFSWAFDFSEEIVTSYLPNWLSFLSWFLALIFWVIIFIIVIYTFTTFTLLIGSPFYAILAEKTENFLSNESGIELSTSDIIKDIPHTIGLELLKFLYRIPILFINFICLLIPVAGPFIIAILSSWGCAMDYTSYGFENNRISFKRTRMALNEHKLLCLSFGVCVWICMLIPIINFMIVPISVCGGTILWHQKLRPAFEEEIKELKKEGGRKIIK